MEEKVAREEKVQETKEAGSISEQSAGSSVEDSVLLGD